MDGLPRVPAGLTPPQVAVLAALVRVPSAWSNLAGLPWCRAEIECLLQAGYLVLWEPPGTDEVHVALSPWGAAVCRVVVDVDERNEQASYIEAPPDDPRDWPVRSVRLPAHEHERPLPHPERVVDPRGLIHLAADRPADPRELMRRLKEIRRRRRSLRNRGFGCERTRKSALS